MKTTTIVAVGAGAVATYYAYNAYQHFNTAYGAGSNALTVPAQQNAEKELMKAGATAGVVGLAALTLLAAT